MHRLCVWVAAAVVLLSLAPIASAHRHPTKLIWEHTVDVHRFFFNRPFLALKKRALETMIWHANASYNALIGKWDGVHRCEGSWRANTGNGYHGGLQMDWSFMRSYGPEFIEWWGGAEAWPAWAQLAAAERAYRSGRGASPWPTCGQYIND